MSCDTKKTKRLQPAELLARIVGWAGTPIVQADVTAISFSVFQFQEATGEEIATSYANVALTISDVLTDSLSLNQLWTEDSVGFNFHFTVPGDVFADRGELYLVRVKFTVTDTTEEDFFAIFILEVE